MPQAAPTPPRSTHPTGASPNAPSLTAAAWNRRPASNRLAHWPHWLRGLPETARRTVRANLAGALSMALPGLALLTFAALHGRTALAVATLLLGASLALVRVTAWMNAHGRPRHRRRPLLVVTAPLLAAAVVAQVVPAPLPAGAMLLAAWACIGLSMLVQLRVGTRRLAWHLLRVLGSVCAITAVALRFSTAGG